MKMGFRQRIKSKIKEGLRNVGALAKFIQDESNHPGRPQPHMTAKNPLWGGEHSPPSKQNSPQEKPSETSSDDSDEFWFLKEGDTEGWHETNPGLKKNLESKE